MMMSTIHCKMIIYNLCILKLDYYYKITFLLINILYIIFIKHNKNNKNKLIKIHFNIHHSYSNFLAILSSER